MKPVDLSHIADNDTVAAAIFLAVHYAECIDATARDEAFPDPTRTLETSKAGALQDRLDTVVSVLGLPHTQAGKTAMMRFLAGFVDILVDQGGELEMVLYAMARPDAPMKVVLTLGEDEVDFIALDRAG